MDGLEYIDALHPSGLETQLRNTILRMDVCKLVMMDANKPPIGLKLDFYF